jgi:sugar lactone lactonase YvrE
MFLTEEPTCVAPVGDHCGEGPVWHAAEQALYWTDINRFLIHRFNPSDRSVKSWFFDEPVTTIVLTDRDNTLAVALGSRVVLWNPLSDERREHGFRLNGSTRFVLAWFHAKQCDIGWLLSESGRHAGSLIPNRS